MGSCTKENGSCDVTDTISSFAKKSNVSLFFKSFSVTQIRYFFNNSVNFSVKGDDSEIIPSAEVVNVGGELKERACDSLIMCIVTTMNQGLRNGGGIGDILRAPSSTASIELFV